MEFDSAFFVIYPFEHGFATQLVYCLNGKPFDDENWKYPKTLENAGWNVMRMGEDLEKPYSVRIRDKACVINHDK